MKTWFLATCLALALVRAGAAGTLLETDANILTAIDESASVGRHGEWLQYNGLAKAVVSREFLEAVQYAGDKRQVGFAVVAWSSHGNVREIVPWMVISTVADAQLAAERIRNAPRLDRSSWDDADEIGAPIGDASGSETDMSATIDAAVGLVVAAPFLGDRGVINILANGRDNVGSGPRPATGRAVGLGFTVKRCIRWCAGLG